MKSMTVIATFFSALALAGPVKRAVVTVWEKETKTVWITAAHAEHGGGHKGWHPASIATDSPSAAEHSSSVVTSSPSISTASLSAATTSSSAAKSSISVATQSFPSINQPGGQQMNPGASIVASSSTKSSAPVQTPSEPDYSKLSEYAKPILQQHNFHRSNHSVNPLLWDDELAEWSKQIAESCVYQHSSAAGDGKYGQNIGAGAPDAEVPALITNGMYNAEINAYPGYDSEPSMSNFHVWGHFSQIVWMDTKTVGCYTKKCDKLGNVGNNVAPYFTVCNYRPAGNMIGNFTKNVFRPKGEQSIIVPPPN